MRSFSHAPTAITLGTLTVAASAAGEKASTASDVLAAGKAPSAGEAAPPGRWPLFREAAARPGPSGYARLPPSMTKPASRCAARAHAPATRADPPE